MRISALFYFYSKSKNGIFDRLSSLIAGSRPAFFFFFFFCSGIMWRKCCAHRILGRRSFFRCSVLFQAFPQFSQSLQRGLLNFRASQRLPSLNFILHEALRNMLHSFLLHFNILVLIYLIPASHFGPTLETSLIHK